MDSPKFMSKCFICEQQFQDGSQTYGGHFVKAYDFVACNFCYEANWDGWSPAFEGKIIQHLKDNKLPIPQRNDKGFLPRD